jgi:hypothetical protein
MDSTQPGIPSDVRGIWPLAVLELLDDSPLGCSSAYRAVLAALRAVVIG